MSSPSSSTRPSPEPAHKRSWALPLAVLAVAALLIAVVVGSGGLGGSRGNDSAQGSGSPVEVIEPEGQENQMDLSHVETRSEDDLMAAGPVDAPVGLVVFSDYQCPFCGRWSAETLPVMQEQVEAGNLRIEIRDLAVFGPASERAARAAYAAAAQGKMWEYHEALFKGGSTRSEAELNEEALTALADELGLDTEKFATDMNSRDTTVALSAYQDQALQLGITSTPVFVLGGQIIVGAQPTEVFQEAFDTALERAK